MKTVGEMKQGPKDRKSSSEDEREGGVLEEGQQAPSLSDSPKGFHYFSTQNDLS